MAYNLAMHNDDTRRHSPAAERNGGAILAELQRLLPTQGLMLEIASGTGQHAARFAAGLPGWQWQPTDVDTDSLPSISAWCADLAQVRAPLRLDVLAQPWPAALPTPVDAMFCANLIHIAPWACTAALMQGAARHLAPHGVLVTYGPHVEEGVPTAPGNIAFDADLRARDAAWGLRPMTAVAAEAARAGLRLRDRVPMPANNLLLVWSRAR